jgi:uncharacterized protein GlcG (DUF336 family)
MSTMKAKTAAAFRASSRAFADMVSEGSSLGQVLSELAPVEGAVPMVVDGKVIGAIGANAR